jgi:hypothetical protein
MLEFDGDGGLVSADADRGWEPEWAAGLGLVYGPIDVLRFWLPDRWLGISDFPLGCPDLSGDPAEFTEETWKWLRATRWGAGEMFTLQLGDGKGELWIDRAGTVHLHSN